jgi:hypothetical protein
MSTLTERRVCDRVFDRICDGIWRCGHDGRPLDCLARLDPRNKEERMPSPFEMRLGGEEEARG